VEALRFSFEGFTKCGGDPIASQRALRNVAAYASVDYPRSTPQRLGKTDSCREIPFDQQPGRRSPNGVGRLSWRAGPIRSIIR